MAEIAFDHVTKEFAGGTVALDDLTLSVPDGEFLILVGPVGLREDDGAAHRRRPGEADVGRDLDRRRADERASRRATATSRWCSRTTRSTRT